MPQKDIFRDCKKIWRVNGEETLLEKSARSPYANQKYNDFKNLYFSFSSSYAIKRYFQGLRENWKNGRRRIRISIDSSANDPPLDWLDLAYTA